MFSWDPAPEKRLENRFALAEIDVRSGSVTPVVQDPEWDCGAPRYNSLRLVSIARTTKEVAT